MNNKLVAAAGVLVIGATFLVGARDDKIILDGEVRHRPMNEYRKGIQIDEYQAPEGKGYQITEQEMRDDGLYRRSYGKGPESDSRSFDWTLVEPKTATST